MSTFDFILNLIRKPKPGAAELRQALADLDVKSAESAAEALESERQELLLKSGTDAQIETIDGRLRIANRQVERLHAAKSNLQRLLVIAEQEEAEAKRLEDFENRVIAARELHTNLIRNYIELHTAATTVADLLNRIKTAKHELKLANQRFLQEGRNDLMLKGPLDMLVELTGISWREYPRYEDWKLDGYSDDSARGDVFARMKELIPQNLK